MFSTIAPSKLSMVDTVISCFSSFSNIIKRIKVPEMIRSALFSSKPTIFFLSSISLHRYSFRFYSNISFFRMEVCISFSMKLGSCLATLTFVVTVPATPIILKLSFENLVNSSKNPLK